MKAIILAAGKASVSEQPICNIDISGHRLLDIQVAVLRSVGVDTIVVVTGYGAETIQRADVEKVLNPDWKSTASAASLACAIPHMSNDEDLIVVYGDTVFAPDAVEALLHSPGEVAALCLLDRQDRDVGQFREYAHVANGRLQHVSTTEVDGAVRTVFTSLVRIKADKVTAIRSHLAQGLFSQAEHLGQFFTVLIHHGLDVTPVIVEAGWLEVGNSEQYKSLLADLPFLGTVLPVHVDWQSRAKRYNELDWVNNDELLSAITRVARSHDADRVLDVGTGTGKVLMAMQAVLGKGEFWGVDSSQAMLDKIPPEHGFMLRCDDAHTLSGLPENYFDLVTARMVFHHIQNTQQALSSITRVMRPGGTFTICEGVPPSLRTANWYTEMFRYKEDRKTLTEVDLIEMMVRAGFTDVSTSSIVVKNASLNNWIDNSGISEENIRKIKELHFEAPEHVKEDYDMEFSHDDCLMTWRFAVTTGRKSVS